MSSIIKKVIVALIALIIGGIAFANSLSLKPIATLDYGGSYVAASSNINTIWVATPDSDLIKFTLDTTTGKYNQKDVCSLSNTPTGIACSYDGKTVFITLGKELDIYVDGLTDKPCVIDTFGDDAYGVACTSDGNTAFVVTSKHLDEENYTEGNGWRSSILDEFENTPHSIACSSDGSIVYVAVHNRLDYYALVPQLDYSSSKLMFQKQVDTFGSDAESVTCNSDGSTVYVGTENSTLDRYIRTGDNFFYTQLSSNICPGFEEQV